MIESKPAVKHVPAKVYVGVFAVLFVVTAIELGITSVIANETVKIIVLLALAVIKALLVVAFFMHLRYDTKTYTVMMLFPVFMAILLAAVVLVAASGI